MKRKVELKEKRDDWTDIIIDGRIVGYIIEIDEEHLRVAFVDLKNDKISIEAF